MSQPKLWLESLWYRLSPWHVVLLPLAFLYWLISNLRRTLYRVGLLQSVRTPVPVVVVGNISVGGTGKTPLVLWLADRLRQQGFRPGIISRGYGGRTDVPVAVQAQDDPAMVGDEPLLLAQKSGCPVWVGRDRAAAARALLQAHPDCDVVLSDDGLQHYRLQRDVEVAVVDGVRRCGNGWLLPAGPLREGAARLASVDAVVVNGGSLGLPNEYGMKLAGRMFYNLHQPQRRVEAGDLPGGTKAAVAGIGNPQRFFAHLRGLGLDFEEHAFPDHHPYRPDDLALAGAEVILMTEKDAVKCAAFADGRCWVLAVAAVLPPDFAELVVEKLRKAYGRQVA